MDKMLDAELVFLTAAVEEEGFKNALVSDFIIVILFFKCKLSSDLTMKLLFKKFFSCFELCCKIVTFYYFGIHLRLEDFMLNSL